ncbi:MAG: tripartite tricarboxylate transporter substrate binding protein [Betaproteobacteria bacterium]|nr:tripartite tricarboxylate transporter substrate binding protein [Betaproteobacteria bacterium]
MKSLFQRQWMVGVTCAATLLGASAEVIAQRDAQSFPTRPVRMINPYTPGGSVDLVGRALAHGLTEIWGQQVIVDNRPGAGTQIGTEIVVRAEPDGYTMMVTSSAISILTSIYRKMRFDPASDLSTVAQIANSPGLLVVHPSVPAKTVQELIAHARARPGELAGASSGVGTTTHLHLEMFKHAAKVNILHVPYKGGAPAFADLIGGQVQLFFNTPGTALPHINAGRLRPLGITSAKRADYLPDIPTIAEAALPGFEAYLWYGIYGPQTLPRPLIQRWNESINRFLKSAAGREHYRRAYMDIVGGTPEAFQKYHLAEIKRWSEIVKAAGIQPQ